MAANLHAATSNNGRLPLELRDMVIDELADDRAALAQCTLVSRRFLAYAAPLLFQVASVDLTTYDELMEFHSFMMSMNADKFLLLRYLSVLRIAGKPKDNPWDEDPTSPKLAVHILVDLLPSLPVRQHLSLVQCRFLPSTGTQQQTDRLASWNRRDMLTLELQQIEIHQEDYQHLGPYPDQQRLMVESLCSVLQLFGTVDTLTVQTVPCRELDDFEVPDIDGVAASLSDLRATNLVLNAEACFIQCMKHSGIPSTLEALQCMPFDQDSELAMQQFLDASPRLVSLHCTPYHEDGPGEPFDVRDDQCALTIRIQRKRISLHLHLTSVRALNCSIYAWKVAAGQSSDGRSTLSVATCLHGTRLFRVFLPLYKPFVWIYLCQRHYKIQKEHSIC